MLHLLIVTLTYGFIWGDRLFMEKHIILWNKAKNEIQQMVDYIKQRNRKDLYAEFILKKDISEIHESLRYMEPDDREPFCACEGAEKLTIYNDWLRAWESTEKGVISQNYEIFNDQSFSVIGC